MYLVHIIWLLLLINTDGVLASMEVAQGKEARSGSVYALNGITFGPSLAVDGNISNNLFCYSCLHTNHTAGITEAYFTINLNGDFTINRVEIFYRDEYDPQACGSSLKDSVATNYRFKGYSIHVSNTSNWRDGTTCYRDTSDPYPPLHVNNTCMGTGSYLTVYNDNVNPGGNALYPVLELCEVKVYGCMLGYFGQQCKSTCPNCKDGECDPDSGVCSYSCKDGWLGEMCNTKCPLWFYGLNCSSTCHHCIDNVTCDHVTGHCTRCARGFYGALCDKECEDQTFGYNCNETCGHCFNSESCNRYDGSCSKGCGSGWSGTLCKTECTAKTFGHSCNESCGNCLNQQPCDRYTGSCPNGCDAGWTGSQCKTECPFGYHGQNCLAACGRCVNNKTCSPETGVCEQGCTEGFGGSFCKDRCQAGIYGKNCLETCGSCINGTICDIYDGKCLWGCATGWRGLTCKEDNDNISNNDKMLTITLGVSSAVLTLTIILVTIACFLRWRRSEAAGTHQSADQNKPADLHELPIRGDEQKNVYDVIMKEPDERSGRN